MIPDTIKKSNAFQSLRTEAAREVFGIFLEKNSDRIMVEGLEFTYLEAENLGVSADRFKRAIDQLIEAGLIDILEKKRQKPNRFPTTLYALSNRWKNYGHKCFRYRERSKRNYFTDLHPNSKYETQHESRNDYGKPNGAGLCAGSHSRGLFFFER